MRCGLATGCGLLLVALVSWRFAESSPVHHARGSEGVERLLFALVKGLGVQRGCRPLRGGAHGSGPRDR